MTVLVAVDQSGHVIGTIAHRVAAAGEGYLRGMAVNPEWHGLGVAQKLLENVESDLAQVALQSRDPGHDSAFVPGDPLLREKWISTDRRSEFIFRHATLRKPEGHLTPSTHGNSVPIRLAVNRQEQSRDHR